MKRKGLSQILYLIIAASVLMMVAMVITFTATDVIGGAGGQATENTCTKAVQGKCAAFSGTGQRVSLPSTCIREEQFIGAAKQGAVYDVPNGGSTLGSPSDGTSPYYITCGTF